MKCPEHAQFRHIHVEITNRCNLRCGFCPGTTRPKTDMTLDEFRAILEQVASLTSQLSLHVLGEPLLHPRLEAMLAACKQAGLSVNLTTNATLLAAHEDMLLAAPALRQINFSLQALEQIPATRPDPLDAMLRLTTRALTERPDLYINYRWWAMASLQTAMADPTIIRYLQRLGQTLELDLQPPPPGRKSIRLRGRVYLHRDTLFSWPGDTSGQARNTGFCHALSTHCAILADGTVCPCCLDADGRLGLGNIHDTPLTQILALPKTVAMRDGFAAGLLVEDLCRHCTYCRRFRTPSRPQTSRP